MIGVLRPDGSMQGLKTAIALSILGPLKLNAISVKPYGLPGIKFKAMY